MLVFVQATTLHRTLADELWQADTTAVPISPLTERHPDLTIEDAYAIQSVNIDRRVANGERICGRKIGLTSKPMQDLLGVDEPDYGVLLDGMFIEDGDVIDLPSLVQPRVEAEMAFVMESDLEGPGVNTATALQAIAGVLPAVEIVDSRVADWKIKLVDTVADNASSGLIVMGGRLRRIDELDLRLIGVAVTRGGELIDTGAGAAALGNPARCIAWLATNSPASEPNCGRGTSCFPERSTRWSGCNRATSFAPSSRTWALSPSASRTRREVPHDHPGRYCQATHRR